MGKVTISAVVPVYNVEKYLKDCLDSITGQIVPFDEAILVNDGSTDNSRRICETYCEKYSYLKIVDQANQGPSAARNVGIRLAAGDYVVFIDSDDMVREDMTLRLGGILNGSGCDAVFYNADVCYEDRTGEPLNYFTRGGQFYGRDMRGKDYLREAFLDDYVVSPCMAAYRVRFIRDNHIYFPEGIYFEDHAFCLQTYLMAETVRCIDHALYIRRCRSGSIMSDMDSGRKCRDFIKVNFAVYDVLEKSCADTLLQVRLVSYYFIMTWKRVMESNSDGTVLDEWNALLDVFCSKWHEKYQSVEPELGDLLTLFVFYSQCGRDNIEQLSIFIGKCLADDLTDLRPLKRRIEQELVQKIKGLPLSDEHQTVGIYGIGQHTERMIDLYKKYVGEIRGNIFFIVTENSGSQSEYAGYPLLTCDRIPASTDRIIISSLTYKKDMLGQLEKAGIAKKIVYELYNSHEFCDLLTIENALQMK